MPQKSTKLKQKTINRSSGSRVASQMRASEDPDEHQAPQHEKRSNGDGSVDTAQPNNVSTLSHGPGFTGHKLLYSHAICSFGNGLQAQTIIRAASLFGNRQEAMVKVLSAGFHPIDQKRRDSINPRQDRSVLGNDIAGLVLQKRNKPPSSTLVLQQGTRIFGQSWACFDSGSPQEVALLDLDYSARIPDHITDNEAATLPSLAFVAYFYLFHPSALAFNIPSVCISENIPQTQKVIAIIGADNNLGRLAVQFASMANIQTIIAIGQIQSFETMKAFGATHLLDIESLKTTEDIQKAKSTIHAVAGGSSLCRIVDTTNWDVTLAASLLDTTTHGKIIGPFARYIDYSRVNRSHGTPRCSIMCGLYIDAHETGSFGHRFWENLPKWLDSRKLTPSKYEIIPGGLNSEMVNEKLDAMGNPDVTDSANFIVRPWDEAAIVELPLVRFSFEPGGFTNLGS